MHTPTERRKRRPVIAWIADAAWLVALAVAFFAGRASVPLEVTVLPAEEVTVRRSEYRPFVEVWRGGELLAEWEPMDGEVWRVLDQVLRDAPELYRSAPGKPPRGRGPRLQEARRR